MHLRKLGILLALFGFAGVFGTAHAEPWIAVKEGMKCAACHVNASGGGMRNAYGNTYAQMQLAATSLAGSDSPRWNGSVNEFVAFGGNLRANARQLDVPGQETQSAFELDEARVYLQFSPVPGRVDIYFDQRIAPGSSTNQEAYARLWSSERDWYLKAGRMYLPYGLRIEDDAAFIRTVPGINFTTPDSGVELGWESARWTAQFALSNGSAGGPETDNGKQASLRLEHVRAAWRMGASANINDTDAGTRTMHNLFAGVRTGPVSWLGEVDFIVDDAAGTPDQRVALLEANWHVRRGHNLKFTTEFLEPDLDGIDIDEQYRHSIFWEYFPFKFTQVRMGVRRYDGDPGIDIQNRTLVVLQVHGFF